MKKVTIILAVFSLVLISTVRADIRLGVKAGVNLASTSFNKDILKSANFTGFQVGPIVEFNLPVTGLGVDAAVLYSQQGLKLKGVDFKKRQSTLDVPVNLKFQLGLLNDLGVYLAAGPYVSFKLSGNNVALATNELKNKSFGAGVNFGGGIELFKHLQVGFNYKLGLTDEYKSLDRSASNLKNLKGKTRVCSITTTYFF
jgi:hypothetical protein